MQGQFTAQYFTGNQNELIAAINDELNNLEGAAPYPMGNTPEFVFERSSKNVLQAMEDLGVIWPVMQDNFYKQWKLYNNKYWPAKYILDREGNLRYIHFGEGEYQKTENVIRYLLVV